MERTGVVTMKGNPVTLVGPEIKVGDKAPDFTVLSEALQPVTLKSYEGKLKIISVAPSLDTPVCDFQLRKFNDELSKLGDNIAVINITMDLPFAIRRFCSVAEIKNAVALSDHRDANFGTTYGVLIKELRLLARAAFVVDENDVVKYACYLPEATDTLPFDEILAQVK